MRSITSGHVKAGLDSVRGAKWRNFWTILGVIIGVTSVITVVGIGEGIKQQITGQISQMGQDLITVRPSSLKATGSDSNSNLTLLSGLNVTGSLQKNDLDTISKLSGVSSSTPLSAVSTNVVADTGKYSGGLTIGTGADLPSLLNQSLAYGAFIGADETDSNVAVLGKNAAAHMFKEDIPLGSTFKINGQEFLVRGIFNNFPATPLSEQADFNNAIFIPYNVAQSLTKNTAFIYEILAKSSSSSNVDKTTKNISAALLKNHGGQKDFAVLKPNENVAVSSGVLNLLTTLITGVAAISLLVGGIGIMNVMLVSVTERMHEIGIRKAIGATNRQIMSQFIIESSVLSVSGGAIGIALAYSIDGLLRLFTNLRPVISWQVVATATIVSLVIGIVFGTLPAVKAARKDPIDALRSS